MIVEQADSRAGSDALAASLYEPLGFVFLRAPVRPIEFYRAVCADHRGDPHVLEFLEDEQVRAAISGASPSLMRALGAATAGPERARALRKFRRYLIRMSTRPTPFGAFAAVALASLGTRTTLRIDETRVHQSRALEIPWLLEFVDEVESDPEIFVQLELFMNPCAFERGGRVFARELSSLRSGAARTANTSVRATRLVTAVLSATRTPAAYESVAAELAAATGASSARIRQFVIALWRQGFLHTELRPAFTGGDPAPVLLRRLGRLRGGAAYERRLAEKLARLEPHVRIDSAVPAGGELNIAVASAAARAAEHVLSMTPWPAGPPYLAAYRRAFEERYGTAREVPLLEMADPEFGIGVPLAYNRKQGAPAEESSTTLRIRRDALFELARTANDERRLEIELDEPVLERLRTRTPTRGGAPNSLEINVFVSAASAAAVDEGRFSVVIGPNVGAMEAARSLGRFAQTLGPAGAEAFRAAARAGEAADPQRLWVELSYLPRNLGLTNILIRPATRRFEIALGTQPGVPQNQAIPLSDLVVGVADDRFFVRSIRLGRRLNISAGHMANVEFAPAICRVLMDLMQDGVAALRGFDWGMAGVHHFLPRVRVGRAVLSVARWRITDRIRRRYLCLDSPAAFGSSLERWRTEWNVPRHVYLTEADNRLVLDLESERDREDLRGELAAQAPDRALLLEEVYPRLEDTWLPGSHGRFVAEFVVPLVVRPPTVATPALSDAAVPSAAPPRSDDRHRHLGSDWLYLKLYAVPSLADDLLTGPIRELTSRLRAAGAIDRWFFVRYADPQPHIRLRFAGSPERLVDDVLPGLIRWSRDLVRADLCGRFAIDSYEREIERYGGGRGIDIAEALFALDSEIVLDRLAALGPPCTLEREEIAMFGLDALFAGLGCGLAQRLDLVRSIGASRVESGSVYRRRKRVLEALRGLHPDSPVAVFVQAMSQVAAPHCAELADIGARLRALEGAGSLTLGLHAIYRSYAHMHCNRLGLDSGAERLAYALLTRNYESSQAMARRAPSQRSDDAALPPLVFR